jgi:hypothetical protein
MTCCEIDLTAGQNGVIELAIESNVIDLDIAASPILLQAQADQIDLNIDANPIVLTLNSVGLQGKPGTGSLDVSGDLVSIQWDAPQAEAANVIQVQGHVLDLNGFPLLSSIVDAKIIVTDSATNANPSTTAVFSVPSGGDGINLAGIGTATLIVRAILGELTIAVTETTPNCMRYLWISAAGHERVYVRAFAGIQELVFA